MKPEALNNLLDKIDALIKSGNTQEAKSVFQSIRISNFSRETRLKFSRMAIRLGQPKTAVRLLNPFVRPKGRNAIVATLEEKVQYALGLTKIGASYEALEILKNLDPKASPDVLLYEAFAYIAIWDYAQAIPLLMQYIESEKITDYQREIARTNLAGALVHEEDSRSESVISTLIENCRKRKYSLLEANGYLYQGEHLFNLKKYDEALESLKNAEKYFNNPESLDALFIQKYRAFIEVCKTKGNPKSLKALQAVREKAIAKNHWETIRDCDKFEAVYLKNESLFFHVYFGTPYDSFRTALEKQYPVKLSLPENFDWHLSDYTKKVQKTITALVEISNKKDSLLKNRQANQRLLLILSSDFYRGYRMASIHHFLYPNEFYNPHSSPLRIRKAVSRLRAWVKEKKIPLSIEEHDGIYRVVLNPGIALCVPRKRNLERAKDSFIHDLKNAFGMGTFTAKQASEVLKMNLWTTLLHLKEAKREGLLFSIGAASKSAYTFSSSSETKKAG